MPVSNPGIYVIPAAFALVGGLRRNAWISVAVAKQNTQISQQTTVDFQCVLNFLYMNNRPRYVLKLLLPVETIASPFSNATCWVGTVFLFAVLSSNSPQIKRTISRYLHWGFYTIKIYSGRFEMLARGCNLLCLWLFATGNKMDIIIDVCRAHNHYSEAPALKHQNNGVSLLWR